MSDSEHSSSRTFRWVDNVAITIRRDDEVREVQAGRFVCFEDQSELIIHFPVPGDQFSILPGITISMTPDEPIYIEICDLIPQPMTADPNDDTATARVLTSIRDTVSGPPSYRDYKCDHGSTQGEGTGVHLAQEGAHVWDCRADLLKSGQMCKWSKP